MKKQYEKPTVESEEVFEVLAAGCLYNDPTAGDSCDNDSGGIQFNS